MTRSATGLLLGTVALACALASPARGGCGVLTADQETISACTSSVRFTLTHPDANLDPGLVESVTINVRSDSEPFGELFPLRETGPDTGVFEGWVPVSGQQDAPGVIFFAPGSVENLIGSFEDPACDQDGDGETGELGFADLDGDGTPNLGANGVLDSPFDSGFDDDNCYNPLTRTDIANPGQADFDTFCVDAAGMTDGTFCLFVAFCSAPYDADGRADHVGDACDNGLATPPPMVMTSRQSRREPSPGARRAPPWAMESPMRTTIARPYAMRRKQTPTATASAMPAIPTPATTTTTASPMIWCKHLSAPNVLWSRVWFRW